MRSNGRWSVAVAATAAALLVLGSQPSHATDPDFNNGVSVLFTLAGDDVDVHQLTPRSDYRVTIASPTERVTWFTDRPDRDAGTVALQAFLRAWGPVGFQADPPNAVIELTDGASQLSVPATIVNPRLRVDGALVFRATVLDESQWLQAAESVALFIDADDGTKEGSTWPMPKFQFIVQQ